MFIVIQDHENMGVYTIFETLLFHGKRVIDKNTIFDNGGTNLHINIFAQGCQEDIPTKFLQGRHGKPNLPKKPFTFIGPNFFFGPMKVQGFFGVQIDNKGPDWTFRTLGSRPFGH